MYSDVASEDKILNGQSRKISSPEVWFAKELPQNSKSCTLMLTICTSSNKNPEQQITFNAGDFILLSNISIKVLSGEFQFWKIKIEVLSKILAFVDESLHIKSYCEKPQKLIIIPNIDKKILCSYMSLSKWFILQIIKNDKYFRPMLSLIRISESYSLIRFLLSNSSENVSLISLCEKYGVSYSHFRRLCYQALGKSVKHDMCNWRMARTMLDLIDSNYHITEVSHKHGYSSSSHFSTEVKNKLGMSPRILYKYTHNFARLQSKK